MPEEQSLRSAPSGRNSEQGLAPRSKYSRRYAAEYFGHRKSWVAFSKENDGGILFMERKHNPNLTENAKELRKNMTKEEKHLWYDFLKVYPVRFLRQKIIDDYIADFYCHRARLVIELDGSQHYTKDGILKDKIRTERIEKRNLTVMRIPNGEINHNFEGICRFIDEFVKESLRQPSADTSL